MSTYNNSLRFYKTYYEGIDWGLGKKHPTNRTTFEGQNKEITESSLSTGAGDFLLRRLCEDSEAIELVTMYPGILMGTGITRGTGLEGEIKIGFYFDHTTGLPVIPGSSVKGTLRSVFPLDYLKNARKADKQEDKALLKDKAAACKEYLATEINEIVEEKNWTTDHIEDLERWLFGDNEAGKDSQVPMSKRVIFYDAYPVRMLKGADLAFMGLDYITPHEPLKDPNPIQFLKVMPGLVYRFQFRWASYQGEKNGLELQPEQLQKLFSRILQDIGIGAKTNVGYGQLLLPKAYKDQYWNDSEKEKARLAKEQAEKARQEKIAKERKEKKVARKKAFLDNVDDSYLLEEIPKPGSTVENVYARVLPLNNAEKEREDKKKAEKRRKRIEIIAPIDFKLGRKWSPDFWKLKPNTIIRAIIEFRNEIDEKGILQINRIVDYEVIKEGETTEE